MVSFSRLPLSGNSHATLLPRIRRTLVVAEIALLLTEESLKIKLVAAGMSAWVLCAVAPLVAHHAFKSEFDMDKPIHLEGKVTQLDWQNPHVYFQMAVMDSKGQTATWRVELVSVNDLFQLGMTRGTISAGSDAVVDGFSAKTGGRNAGAMDFTMKTTGRSFSLTESWKRWDIPSRGTRRKIYFPSELPLTPVREQNPAK